MPVYQIFPSIIKHVETFTSVGEGTTISTGNNPVKNFAIQVEATGAVTSWAVSLQTSIDGINFTTLLTHTNATKTRIILYATVVAPALYFRAKCTELSLGSGTNVIMTMIGSN